MRNFKTGARRDSADDKESYTESISQLALRRYAFYMKSKEKLYGKGNWRKGIPKEVYLDSLLRHLNKFLIEKQDGIVIEESDHLAACFFNLQGYMHEEEKEKLTVDNSG
jgi:hypothetical protein